MIDDNRWLLPEGIEEVLPAQAARLERLRRGLLDLYHGWGYELVLPPFIDYLESLLTGAGHDLQLQTFTLVDQLSGRLLGIRADMTPQVARIDAHALRREVPTRLCYLGTVLHTRPDGFARSRSPFQVGAELYGHAGIESDVEVLGLMLETLDLTRVRDVHLDLGHVGVFGGLARAAGLDAAAEASLFDMLQRKAKPEIDAFVRGLDCSESLRGMFAALADLNGDASVLEEARARLAGAGDEVARALDELAAVAAHMALHRPDTPLYVDLAELRGYHYHTGVVFAAFVPGHGQEIARGGRYDAIGRVFGRARPATGFSADLKTLMALGEAGPTEEARGGIFAPAEEASALLAEIRRLRAAGERVVCALPGQPGGAFEMGCDRCLVLRDGEWRVEQA